MLNTLLNTVLRHGLTNILGGARGGGAAARSGVGGLAGQAAITAALGMLMRRGGAGRLLKVGGVAALGMMAYKAWQEHQARQGAARTVAPGTSAAGAVPTDAALPAEGEAQALLVAMIAAAKADGHVDAGERAQIERALADAQGQVADPDLMAWFDAELRRPLDAEAVARAAAGQPALAAQMYLASVIVIGTAAGPVNPVEQDWLDALGHALQLPQPLRASLHAQAAELDH